MGTTTAGAKSEAELVIRAQHTPTPWKFSGLVTEVADENGGQIDNLWCGSINSSAPKFRGQIASIQSCDHIGGISCDEAEANAAFIVRAVNAHDDLVKAISEYFKLVDRSPLQGGVISTEEMRQARTNLRAALSKAGA